MPSRKLARPGLAWILCLGLLGSLSAQVGAQETSWQSDQGIAPGASLKEPGAYTLIGFVVDRTENTLVINDLKGDSREFALDPEARYTAALNPGDQVRVYYDPIRDDTDLAKNIQTLNVTARMSQEAQQDQMFAMSQPPTQSPRAEEAPLIAQASTPSGTASGTTASASSSAAAGAAGVSEELPGTASSLPLVATMGILFLSTAFGVGLVLRRIDQKA